MKISDFIKLRDKCEKNILERLKYSSLYDKGIAHIVREELLKAFNDIEREV